MPSLNVCLKDFNILKLREHRLEKTSGQYCNLYGRVFINEGHKYGYGHRYITHSG